MILKINKKYGIEKIEMFFRPLKRHLYSVSKCGKLGDSKTFRIWEVWGESAVLWAYVLENVESKDFRDNKPLFLLIRDLEITENNLFIDRDTDIKKPELKRLLDIVSLGDRLAIRSIEDLADSLSDLIDVFQIFTDKQIILFSCEEPVFSGTDYLESLTGFVKLYLSLEKRKRQKFYQQAVEEGRVGRPAKTKEIEQAISLYNTGNYKVNQIEAITGISKSTLYRYLKKE